MKIKKGDIVSRNSYGNDILFTVERIIPTKENTTFAILKGLTIRIESDANVEDLKLVGKDIVETNMRSIDDRLENIVKKTKKGTNNIFFNFLKRSSREQWEEWNNIYRTYITS